MARKRMIDPQIWVDPRIGQLTRDERLLFIGCLTIADDEGRLLGNPAILRAQIFPYDDLTIEQITVLRDRILEMNKNLILYDVDGVEYMAFLKWSRYQKPSHPTPSRLPPPPLPNGSRNTHDILPNGSRNTPPQVRLGKVRLGKVRLGEEPSSSAEKSPERKKTISAFVKLYTASPPGVDPPYHLYPSEAILDDIDLLAELWGDDAVQEAIATAVAVGKVKVARAYLEAIILNWKEEGKVKPRLTKEQYEALETKRSLG